MCRIEASQSYGKASLKGLTLRDDEKQNRYPKMVKTQGEANHYRSVQDSAHV